MSEVELSRLLFYELKPHCTELSNYALLPAPVFHAGAPQLIRSLADIQATLAQHFEKHRFQGKYKLAANLADYVFFPLSNLLQKPALSDAVVKYIFSILDFLVEHVWSAEPNPQLMAQLYSLVVFLMSGNNAQPVEVSSKELEFRINGASCLNKILGCLSDQFFLEPQNLALLGRTISLLLDLLSSCNNPQSNDEIALANSCLVTIDGLYTASLSPDQLSHVLPGTVSKIVNFYTQSRSLHFTIIVNILATLRHLIVKVFNDEDLQIVYKPDASVSHIAELGSLWESNLLPGVVAKTNDNFHIPEHSSGAKHRTAAWLRATSKQLKISLTILFKDLLGASNNKIKIQTKTQIEDEVVLFVQSVLSKCFVSLFNELIMLLLDVLPMLVAGVTENRTVQEADEMILKHCKVFTSFPISPLDSGDKSERIFNQVSMKLEDLIKNKIASIMLSVDDTRIRLYLVSIKFQFLVVQGLQSLNSSLGSDTLRLEAKREYISELSSTFLTYLQRELVRSMKGRSGQKKRDNKDILSILSGENATRKELEEQGVKLDNNNFDGIELPASIDARKVARIANQHGPITAVQSSSSYAFDMSMLAKSKWQDLSKVAKGTYFSGVFSSSIEEEIVDTIQFVGYLEKSLQASLKLIERVLATDSYSEDKGIDVYVNKSLNLWIGNNLLVKLSTAKAIEQKFNTDQFLQFDEDEEEGVVRSNQEELSEEVENISYLILEQSQMLIDEMAVKLSSPQRLDSSTYKVYETSYAVAIDSIGALSNVLGMEDFQRDFLIEYLYPLLEGLTYQSNPLIQSHAQSSVQLIIDNYYGGSLNNMIMDNLDYLIDCLSLKLSVASSLTPSLPGILLVILKISGIELLQTNQLNDIFHEMFTLIDMYHGYSSLVEGFFFVFGELIGQIDNHYPREPVEKAENSSKYKPWGMTSIEQVLQLVDDSEKISDPYGDYDPNKEYFHRKKDAPFSEMDSDDEEEEDQEENGDQAQEVAKWDSNIPKPTYELVQKIFNYSFRLLQHPSKSLKFQLLTILNKMYPLLSSNYSMVLPLISKHWPVLLTLVAGTENLSTDSESGVETSSLIVPAIELTTTIIREDERHNEAFLGRKFVEMWDFLKMKSVLFKPTSQKLMDTKAVSTSAYDPPMVTAYVRLILAGLQVYRRTIPDMVAVEMTEFCWRSGIKIDTASLSGDTQNILWVLRYQHTRTLNTGQE